MQSKQVWMNGRLVPAEQATVPFLNTGLHYGLAVFEGIRAYRTARGPAVFRLREHVERLLHSAHVLAMPAIPWSEAEIVAAVREVVAANGFDDCYVRPLIYLSEGGWNLDVGNGKASLEESYAGIDNGEVWLLGCDIPEYLQANRMNHKPKRPRKLLLHRREIDKLIL